MILTIAKYGDRVPVEVESLDDPKVRKLIAEHGAGSVFLDGKPLSELPSRSRLSGTPPPETSITAGELAGARDPVDDGVPDIDDGEAFPHG